jgi:arylsulfatase A-like enzyme
MTEAIRWLDQVDGSPFFLWTHLYDPHRPYDPPEPFRSKHLDPYVGEIAFADAQIGRLLESLDRHRLATRTIVIVVGDHGESLEEHGERDHGIFVYENVLHVPLIVRAPAVPPGRVGPVVRLTDVFHTVLDLLGLPASPGDGVSLRTLMMGQSTSADLEAYSESLYPRRFGWSSLHALRDGRFKLIDAPRRELYDLEQDPFEEHNIYAERRSIGEAMASRLSAIASRASAGSGGSATGVPPEVRERLRALGYVAPAHGSVVSVADHDLPDPKDCLGRALGPADSSDVAPSSIACR